MTRCGSCKAPIFWAKTIKGRSAPIDQHPVERGNIRMTKGVAHVLTGAELIAAREKPEPLYLNHFASCPNAKGHRPG